MKSLDSQLASSLLTTCSRLVIIVSCNLCSTVGVSIVNIMLRCALCILSVVLSSKQQAYSNIYYKSNIHTVVYSTDKFEKAADDEGRQLEHGKHVFLSNS